MYLISMIVMVVLFAVIVLMGGESEISYFLDIPSLVLLLLMMVPIVLAAGLWKDFVKSFQIVFKKAGEIPLVQLKRSYEAVSLSMKCLLYSGVFLSVIGGIQILRLLSDVETLGVSLLTALLASLYALCLNIILLPLKYKIKAMIIENTHE